MTYPNPFNNPTLEGFDILHTSPTIVGAFQRPHRALVCRYSDPAIREGSSSESFILWQERNSVTGDWQVTPGSSTNNCEALILALLTSPTPEEN